MNNKDIFAWRLLTGGRFGLCLGASIELYGTVGQALCHSVILSLFTSS